MSIHGEPDNFHFFILFCFLVGGEIRKPTAIHGSLGCNIDDGLWKVYSKLFLVSFEQAVMSTYGGLSAPHFFPLPRFLVGE